MAEPIAGSAPPSPVIAAAVTRKEKRKALKKQKRKQARIEMAIREREEEEKLANDPEEQLRIKLKEEEEAAAAARERIAFEESERRWLEAAEVRKKEEEERRKRIKESIVEKNQHSGEVDVLEDDDEWEYIEEGPAEIIWQGNEIIVKKKRIKVAKTSNNRLPAAEGDEQPTSNPFPPQSEAFDSYLNESRSSAKELLDKVAQEVPNFGTEQDKAHCPFHLKTGACRFGSRCSRIHFYPDKSCTLLMKNMYNGSGLALEQDEGLEYTDEEVEQAYEEFYEDVHTEFQKFGELVNFKVCKNSSCHLRGNVYVHYKSLDAAVLAYNSINGRFYGGRQITCEFVGVTKWRIAICGEFMKSRLKTCSHGAACNFIHCFRNPGGDYEWADWDKPPPRYWMRKMVALFGYSDDDRPMELEDHEREKDLSGNREHKTRRYHSRRSSRSERKYDNDSPDNDSDLKDNDFGRHSDDSRHIHTNRKEDSSKERHDFGRPSDDSRRIHTNRKEDSSKERHHSFGIKEEKFEKGYSHQHKRHKSKDTSKKQNLEKTKDDGEIHSRKKHKSRYSEPIVKEDESLERHSDYDGNNIELTHDHSSSLAFENSSQRFRLSIDEERYCGSGTEDHLQRNSSMASPGTSQHSREQVSYDGQSSSHHSRHKSHHSEETNGRNSRLGKQKSKHKRDYSPELAGNSKDVIEGYDQDEAYYRSGHSSRRSSRRHGGSTKKRKHHI